MGHLSKCLKEAKERARSLSRGVFRQETACAKALQQEPIQEVLETGGKEGEDG